MKILVVGAGIAGLSFVRALQCCCRSSSHAIHSIEIIERRPAFREGVGIVLHPNGLHILNVLGLLHDIVPLTNVIDAIQVTRNGKELTIDMKEVWGADNLTRTIQRKDLHTLLAGGIEDACGLRVKLRMGCGLESIVEKEGTVIARFDNGKTDEFDLVVGADGVHSKVRECLFPGTEAISTNLLYFRFLAENGFGFGHHVWKTFEKEEGAYGFIPLAGNKVHCFVQLLTAGYPCTKGMEEAYFRSTFLQWDRLLEKALAMRSTTLHTGWAYMVPPGSWSRGHCVLMGDAAHAVSPTLSEGGSLAMEDALVLALALSASSNVEESITFYCDARRERCLRSYRMSLSQLNTLRRRRIGPKGGDMNAAPDKAISTRVMAGMYKPLLEDPLPPPLQSVLKQINHLHNN